MKIPTEATDILTRMSRRGYTYANWETWICISTKRRRHSVQVVLDHTPGHHRIESDERASFLACCRDIERQWKADQ